MAITLDSDARHELATHGVTATDWALEWFGRPAWQGDSCGCPDDRCTGHHHDAGEPCGCLTALLETPTP